MVIVGSAKNPLVRRLREESEALGFSVDLKPEDSGPLAEELDRPSTIAAMRLREEPSESLELVIVDPKSQQVFHEELPIRVGTDPTADEVVATRAIELLRAIRLGAPRNPEPVIAVPAQPERPANEPAEAAIAVSLAPLVSFAPGLRLGTSAELNATYAPQHLGLDVGIVAPVTSQRLNHQGGEVTASAAAIHGGVVGRTSSRARLGLQFALDVEASRVRFEGMAPAPLANPGATVFTVGPRLEVVAALHVVRHLRLIVPVSASYVLPHTVIRFAGQPLQDWGPLLLRFGIGLECSWP